MQKKPAKPAGKEGEKTREDRLKSALKANIARRKEQTRARQAQGGKEG